MTEPTTRVRVADPAGILSIVPLLVGYQPSAGDTVMLGISDLGRVVVGMRFDAHTAREIPARQMENILANIKHAGARSAILVGYGNDVTPAVDRVRDLIGQELDVRDALRVDGNRYWSYMCDDLDCCPPEGRTFEPESEASTTLRAEAGVTAAPSREDIAASIAAPAGEQAEAARQAWERAVAEPRTYQTSKQAVVQAVADCREGKLPDREQATRLAAALTDIRARDYAWALQDREHAEQGTELWKSVVRNVTPEAAAAPASLLAFTSWQAGNGALANLAIDRALEANSGYSMAKLLDQALQAGVPPSQATPPMTPAEIEESYGVTEPEVDDYELEPGQ